MTRNLKKNTKNHTTNKKMTQTNHPDKSRQTTNTSSFSGTLSEIDKKKRPKNVKLRTKTHALTSPKSFFLSFFSPLSLFCGVCVQGLFNVSLLPLPSPHENPPPPLFSPTPPPPLNFPFPPPSIFSPSPPPPPLTPPLSPPSFPPPDGSPRQQAQDREEANCQVRSLRV